MMHAKRPTSTLKNRRSYALEPRVLLDAAAVATAAEVAADAADHLADQTADSHHVDPALFAAPATQGRREAYVVDTSVQGYQALLAQVPTGAEIFLINDQSSGLAQLNAALSSAGGTFDAVHIVSHGGAGSIQLGTDIISLSTLSAQQTKLTELGSHIAADGDLLIYGCDVASSTDGKQLLDKLANVTGADVAASTNATGGAHGDAILEAFAGKGVLEANPWQAVGGLHDALGLEGYYAGREEGDISTTDGVYSEVGAADNDGRGYSMDGAGDWVVWGSNGKGLVSVRNMVTEVTSVIAKPAGASNAFGGAVAMSSDGQTIAIGDRDAGTQGYVYVYKLNGTTWDLKNSINIATNGNPGTRIGVSGTGATNGSQWLDIEGSRIAVGVPDEGSAGDGQGRVVWIRDTSAGNWSSISSGYFDEYSWKTGVWPFETTHRTGGQFGASVSIAGDILVVGAPTNSESKSNGGALTVYTWTASGTTGTGSYITNKILSTQDAYFGAALDVSYTGGEYILAVGAPGEGSGKGELYVYTASTGNFGGYYDLHSRVTSNNSNYGIAVKVSNQGEILVGAAGTDSRAFHYSRGVWGTGDTSSLPSNIIETVITPSMYGGLGSDKLGRAVAFWGLNSVALGGPGFDGAGTDRGGIVAYQINTDRLGYSVDAAGEWVVSGGQGELQVWRVAGADRVEQKITPPTGSTSRFGEAVSIENYFETVGDEKIEHSFFVVADPGKGTSGWIYVYKLNTTTGQWGLQNSIDIATVTGWSSGDRIGSWVNNAYSGNQWIAISEGRIAVGAPSEGSNSGRIAWIRDQSAGSDWSGTFTSNILDEPESSALRIGSANSTTAPALFGASVAIAGDILIVGAPGADIFGGISGGSYGAGAVADNKEGSRDGTVLVYEWDKTAGTALKADNSTTSRNGFAMGLGGQADHGGIKSKAPNNDAYFGAAVDITYYNGTYTIVAGAPGEDGNKGEVYVYQGATASSFTAPTNIYNVSPANSNFGLAVAVSQYNIVVGAPNHSANSDNGVYYFGKTNNVWSGMDLNGTGTFATNSIEHKFFTASTYSGAGDDRFGRSVAFANGNNIMAGAPYFGADDRGAVLFYYAKTPVAANDTYEIWENGGKVSPSDVDGSNGAVIFKAVTDNDIKGLNWSNVSIADPLFKGYNGKGELSWNAATQQFTFNPKGEFEYLSAGESEVIWVSYTLQESGTNGFSSTATVKITVKGQNDAPVKDAGIDDITVPRKNEPAGVPAGPQSFSTGTITIPFNAFFDVDQSDILTYSLVSVTPVGGAPAAPVGAFVVSGGVNKNLDFEDVNFNTGKITYNLTGMTENTAYTVTVRASDGNGGTVDTSFVFTVARDNENPEKNGNIPNQSATEDSPIGPGGDGIDIKGYFKDPDPTGGSYPESLTYSIVTQTGPGPDWLVVTAEGKLVGSPANENVGSHTVRIRATDIFGNWIESNDFTITVANTNDAPELVVPITPKVSIKGESFSFSLGTGEVKWNGVAQPIDNAGPFFVDPDNSTADGRTPVSPADTITYTAFNAVTGAQITTSSGGASNPANDTSWLRFNGADFTGTSSGTLGSSISIRLVATDNHGAASETIFNIGIFPRDGGTPDAPIPTVDVKDYGGQLGYSLAINTGGTNNAAGQQGATGRWAVVGEPGYNGGDGRIIVYENTNYTSQTGTPVWVQRAVGVGSSGQALGTSVSISANGLLIAAGAPMDSSGKGAVFLYQNKNDGSANPWITHPSVAKVTASGGANGDRFGMSVALNEAGDHIIVGAPFNDDAGTNAGAAYWGGISASLGNKLLPTFDTTNGDNESGTARAGDLFGSSVAFDQNMLVVGAPRDDHHGKTDAGSVYVYSTDNTVRFTKLTKGYAADGKLEVGSFDYFGTSVAVDSFNARNEVVIAVGTPNDDYRAQDAGAVYIFRSTTMVADNTGVDGLTSFTDVTRIIAYNGLAYDNFGSSVAIDATELDGNKLRLAVGAAQSNGTVGSAYAYRYMPGSGWFGQRYLSNYVATDPAKNVQNYGGSVAIGGSFFMVGAPGSDRVGTGLTGLSSIPMAGKFFSVNISGTTIETLSGSIVKTVGSGEPLPVILTNNTGSGSGTGSNTTPVDTGLAATLTNWDSNSDKDELRRLLRPVTGWSVDVSPTGEPIVMEMPAAANAESYSDALLFDVRTAVKGVDNPVVDGDDANAPASEDTPEQQQAEPAEAADVVATLRGLSTQVEAVASARSRAAQDLLASLQSLAG